jgi:hypothetical protein
VEGRISSGGDEIDEKFFEFLLGEYCFAGFCWVLDSDVL